MPAPVLFTDLSIGYAARRSRRVVAEHLTADLAAGRLTVLVGVNGSGKSTLLRTLAGLLPPLSGECSLCGMPLRRLKATEVARRVAVVLTAQPESFALRAREVVEWGRMPYLPWTGRLSASDYGIARRALEQVDAAALSERPLDTLSDGERARVFIAKALAQEAPVIMLDEPTAFLDYPAKRRTFALLRRLAEEGGKAVLVSTHDLDLALHFAHRAWLLRPDGLESDTVEALRPVIEREFMAC